MKSFIETIQETSNDSIDNLRHAKLSKKRLKSLKKDTKALMLYLQDKKDHKKYCPEIDWKQPPLTTYKKDPKSYLPKECKQ